VAPAESNKRYSRKISSRLSLKMPKKRKVLGDMKATTADNTYTGGRL
jgi:hypothetical protein